MTSFKRRFWSDEIVKSSDELRTAEEFLHAEIPLTRAMGVRVVLHASGFAIEAPVALNHNHLHTAFGGSINSVATLAGYAFLWLELRDVDAHLVIRESSIHFVRPVRARIHAVCTPPGEEQLATFTAALRSDGKARIPIQVLVEEDGALAARFTATFVGVMNSATKR